MRYYGVIVAFLYLALPAWSQVPPLIADRPGIGIGAGIVLPETFQVESGFAYNRAPHFNGYSFGQLLLRYGLNPLVELQVNLRSYRIERYPRNEQLQGFEDPRLGFKVALHESPELLIPSAAVLFTMRLPVGKPGLSGTFGTAYGHASCRLAAIFIPQFRGQWDLHQLLGGQPSLRRRTRDGYTQHNAFRDGAFRRLFGLCPDVHIRSQCPLRRRGADRASYARHSV